MKFLKIRKQKPQSRLFSLARSDSIDKQMNKIIDQYGKGYCLDIGCGRDKDARFQSVDIDPNCNPDYVGDVRVMFAPSPIYSDKRSDSQLNELPVSHFMVVRLKHLAEHIEWMYQLTFFEWVRDLMASGGLIVVDTPNLEYIAKVYLLELEKQATGKTLKYPYDEHPDLDIAEQQDMQRWVNFKLFSGGSPGDYHYTCFDKFWLAATLSKVGFEQILISNSPTLRVLARKSDSDSGSESLDQIIDQLGV